MTISTNCDLRVSTRKTLLYNSEHTQHSPNRYRQTVTCPQRYMCFCQRQPHCAKFNKATATSVISTAHFPTTTLPKTSDTARTN